MRTLLGVLEGLLARLNGSLTCRRNAGVVGLKHYFRMKIIVCKDFERLQTL